MLLHVGDTLVQRTFDPWVAALAALLFAAVAVAVWVPRGARRRVGRRAASIAMAISMGLALLPTVLPYDHFFLPTLAHSAASEQVHQAHCHGGPASCSDAPVSSGAGQFLTSEPLLADPALTSLLMLVAVTILVGVYVRPALRPPSMAGLTI